MKTGGGKKTSKGRKAVDARVPRAGDGVPLDKIGRPHPGRGAVIWTYKGPTRLVNGEERQGRIVTGPVLMSPARHVDAFAASLAALLGISELDARQQLRAAVVLADQAAREACRVELVPLMIEDDRRRGTVAVRAVIKLLCSPGLLDDLGALSVQAHRTLGADRAAPLDRLRDAIFQAALATAGPAVDAIETLIKDLNRMRGKPTGNGRPPDVYVQTAAAYLADEFERWTGRQPTKNPDRSGRNSGLRRPLTSSGLAFVQAGLRDLGKLRSQEALGKLLARADDKIT